MADARRSPADGGGFAVSSARNQLAIDGGAPVRSTLLPYGHQQISEEEVQEVARVLRGDWITQGPAVRRFERCMAEILGRRHAVAFSSGTAALHGCAHAAGLEPGTEAVVPTLSFLASANAVAYCGAKPVLTDVDASTLNSTADLINSGLSSRTRAVIAVDFAGLPCAAAEIAEASRRHGLTFIQDACHALGARVGGRPAGALADLAAYSFHPVKAITTGEGGLVATDDTEAARRLRRFATHGVEREPSRMENFDGPWRYEMQALGYNYRITDFQCALGVSQAGKLETFIRRRQEIARQYDAWIDNESGIRRAQPQPPPGADHAYHLYTVRLEMNELQADRCRVFEALRAENIGVQVHYLPIHLHPYYRHTYGYRSGDFPAAESYYSTCLSLPIYPSMTEGDLQDVITAFKKVLTAYRTRPS